MSAHVLLNSLRESGNIRSVIENFIAFFAIKCYNSGAHILDYNMYLQYDTRIKSHVLGPELQCLLNVKEDLSDVLIFQHVKLNAK